jgi:D-glycero-D-manno-heptose 1,7-bisphosphate phosphatase
LKRVIFLDRDGVINIDKHYLYRVEDFEFMDGLIELLIHLKELGYIFVIVTNQSGVGRGYYSIDDLDILHSWLEDELKKYSIEFFDICYCPHIPDDSCICRKPNIGMIESISSKIDIDFKNSWLIGDKESDIQTALNSGIKNSILVSNDLKKIKDSQASYSVENLSEITKIIKS